MICEDRYDGGVRAGTAAWRRLGLLCQVVCCLVLFTWGCCRHRVPAVLPRAFTGYVSPNVAHLPIYRVLLLPIENQTSHRFADSPLHEQLATELRSTKLFDVVTCPDSFASDFELPRYRTGTFPLGLLASLRARFHVDAVIFSSISEFYPYWPPKIGLELQMVDTAFGETIASVSGVWDSRHAEVSCQAKSFFQRRPPYGTLGNPDMVLQSPGYYSEFVTHDAAHGLAELWLLQKGSAVAVPAEVLPARREASDATPAPW